MQLSQPNLSDILTSEGKTYLIPSFQRAYKWDEGNWEDLFEELIQAFFKEEGKKSLPLGNNSFVEVVNFFYEKIDEQYQDESIVISEFSRNLFETITGRLKYIQIELDENEDSNLIFETLNARGKALESGDQIRNYIFMNPKITDVNTYYDKYWEPLEVFFAKESEKNFRYSFSEFLRYFLFANMDESRSIKSEHIYSEMKDYLNEFFKENAPDNLFVKLHKYKTYFEYFLEPSKITVEEIQNCLYILKYMEHLIFTPIFLKAFELNEDNKLSKETLKRLFILLTSYSFRLSIAGKKVPNKVIPEIVSILSAYEEEQMLKEVEASIKRQKASPFIEDETFIEIAINSGMYTQTRKNLIKYILLLSFRIHSKQNISHNDLQMLTLEHIFPRSSKKWKEDLTPEEYKENLELTDSIGNLTIVNQHLNSKLSNSGFAEKKESLYSYSIWKYESDNYFKKGKLDKWTKKSIHSRARLIIQNLLTFLKGPDPEVVIIEKSEGAKWFVAGKPVNGVNQKAQFLNAIAVIRSLVSEKNWKKVDLHFASYNKNRFSTFQKKNLKEVDGVFINSHGSHFEKARRLSKLAQYFNISFTTE